MTFYYLKVVKSKNLEFDVLSFWAGTLIAYTTIILVQKQPDIFRNNEKDLQQVGLISISSESSKIYLMIKYLLKKIVEKNFALSFWTISNCFVTVFSVGQKMHW